MSTSRDQDLSSAAQLFPLHLDLSSLRGRRRGLVRCIFHEDRRPSLSIDLDAGIFHCFGCGAAGGHRRFAQLVGAERASAVGSRCEQSSSPLTKARRDAIAEIRRQQREHDRWRPMWRAADAYREVMLGVLAARKFATTAGPTEVAWNLLGLAAAVEGDALNELGE